MEIPKLLFGTNNKHKLSEIRELLEGQYHILSLADISLELDVEETANSLEGNARLKARSFYEAAKIPCFSDDTGLEVDALKGAPGVYSARFAGEHASSQDNIKKMLSLMENEEMRSARFRTVISFYNGREHLDFEGKIEGRISQMERGKGGFGYDPIFIPEEEDHSFAEMSPEEKNAISHRGRAIRKFVTFLKNSPT